MKFDTDCTQGMQPLFPADHRCRLAIGMPLISTGRFFPGLRTHAPLIYRK